MCGKGLINNGVPIPEVGEKEMKERKVRGNEEAV